MRTIYGIVPWFMLAVGVIVCRAGWRCITRGERAGPWAHPAAAVAVVTFLAGMLTPLALWVGGRTSGASLYNPGSVFSGVLFYVLVVALYSPLLAYHAGVLLAWIFSTASEPPPEPADPFERAVAAEERGDVRAAIERYWKLLDDEPAHIEARTRLGKLLARTRRFSWAVEVIEQGLALGDLSSVEKAGWKALLGEWEEGKLVEPPPGDVKREDLAIYRITTARITSRTAAHGEGGKDGPEDERPIEL